MLPASKCRIKNVKLLQPVELFSNSILIAQERLVKVFFINPSIREIFHSFRMLSHSGSISNILQPRLCCLFVCFLPLQVCPSPVYPALQLQEYEPTVFTQSAFTSQLWVLVAHSSRSAKSNWKKIELGIKWMMYAIFICNELNLG